MAKMIVIVLAAVGLAGPAASAVRAEPGFAIVTSGPRPLQRIGPYAFASPRNAGRSYPAAVEAFGPPTSRQPSGRSGSGSCTVRWAGLGLAMAFVSTSRAPCSSASLDSSVWFGATISDERWRTDRGLRVGDTLPTLRRLYPRAKRRSVPAGSPIWVLVSVPGEVGRTIYLEADVRGGRVAVLRLPPGNLSVGRRARA